MRRGLLWTRQRLKKALIGTVVTKEVRNRTGWWFEPLRKIWKSIGMIIPNIWENKIDVNQTTNQGKNEAA